MPIARASSKQVQGMTVVSIKAELSPDTSSGVSPAASSVRVRSTPHSC